MNAGPKEKKGDNRLRVLRRALGISQKRLAEISGISLETVRSIEVGRRKLTDEVLKEVSDATSGKWNNEAGLWEFAFKPNNMSELIPLTRELFTEYRRVIETPPGNKEQWRQLMVHKVQLLLDHVSEPRWYSLLLRIERCMGNWLSEFDIEGKVRAAEGLEVDLREYFSKSRLAFLVVFDPRTGKIHQFTPLPADMTDMASEIRKQDFQAAVRDPAKPSKRKSS